MHNNIDISSLKTAKKIGNVEKVLFQNAFTYLHPRA